MHDVFISYSSKNKTIADAVCNRLESANIKCWYAPRDIAPGEDWEDAIINAIKGARIFILIYTKDSNASKQVLNEVANASHANCVLLPFRVDDCDMSPKLSYYLTSVHWMDAMTPPLENSIYALTARISEVLGNTPPPPPPTPPTPPTQPTPPAPPPKKKSKCFRFYLLTFAAILVILYTITDIARYINQKYTGPTFKLELISAVNDYYYPYCGTNMISTDMDSYFMKQDGSGNIHLISTSTGVTLNTVENVFDDPRNVSVIMDDAYSTIYFLEFIDDAQTIRSYDRITGKWISKDPIDLKLNENEYVEQYLTHSKYLGQSDKNQDELIIFVFDTVENKYTKTISLYPDGELQTFDISEYDLYYVLASIDIPEKEDIILISDTDKRTVVFDVKEMKPIDIDRTQLVNEYMPYLVDDMGFFSSNGRYCRTFSSYQNSTDIIIWDMLTGKPACDYITASGNLCFYFIGDSEFIYYDQDEACLYYRDLESKGVTVSKLGKDYFEKEPAFSNFPMAFWYDVTRELCVFAVVDYNNGMAFDIIVTDLEGNVFSQSKEVAEMKPDDVMVCRFTDNALVVILTEYDAPHISEKDLCTRIYRAKYSINSDGVPVFRK